MVRKINMTPSVGDQLGAILSQARKSAGAPSGTVVTHNADGTKTISGPGAGAAGVALWVGDTTPPGKPAGLSASSKNGVVIVTWDGSLEGDRPEDFGKITVAATVGAGTPRVVGELVEKGSLVIDGLTPGDSVTVSATASDLARDESGALTPNVSGATTLPPVTVTSVVAQADIDAMNQKLANAEAELEQSQTDITAARTDAQNALDQLAGTSPSTLGDRTAQAASKAETAQSTAAGAANAVFDAIVTAGAAAAAASAALSAAQDFIKDPQFVTGADNVKQVTINASDSNAGKLPGTAQTYGKVTGNDNWTLNTLITTVPGHVYEWSVWAKVASDNTQTGNNGFGLMVWRLTSDGNTAQGYAGNGWPEGATTLADWKQLKWRWTAPSDGSWPFVRPALRAGGYKALVTDWHVRDVTDVEALEQAAATAKTAADAADAKAVAAQQAATDAKTTAGTALTQAQTAKTTADGKNKIIPATTQPATTGLVAGDLWFQLNSSGNVVGIKVFNGSAFVDYVLLASQILVAGSVGTIQLANGAVNADKVTASVALLNKLLVRKLVGGDIAADTITATNLQANEAMLVKLLVRKLKADELEVGQIAAAIIKSGSFQATDGAGNVTVSIDGATGKLTAKEAAITGTLQTGEDGNRVVVSTQEITYPGEEAGPAQEVGAVSFYSGKTGEKAATVSSVTTSDVTGGKYLLHLTGGAPSEAAWTALSTKPELLISTAGSSDGSVVGSEAVLCGDQVYLGSYGKGELDGVVIESGNGAILSEGGLAYRKFTAGGEYVWNGSGWVACATLLDVSDLLTARPDGAYPIEFATATLNTRTRVLTMSARVRRAISKSSAAAEPLIQIGSPIRPAAGQGASGWGGRDSPEWTIFVATASDGTSIQGTPFGSVVGVGEHVTWSLSWLTA